MLNFLIGFFLRVKISRSNTVSASCLYALLLTLLVPLLISGGSRSEKKLAPTHYAQVKGTATQNYQPGEVLVKFRPWALAFQQIQPGDFLSDPALKKYGLLAAQAVPNAPALFRFQTAATDVKALAARLAQDGAIEYAEPDYVYQTAQQSPNDPFYKESRQYYLAKTSTDAAWNITTGVPLTVAVVDSGVQAAHPDLNGKVLAGFNAITGSIDTNDDNGHGTFIAGIIAANTNNGTGIAGINWAAKILPIKVADSAGDVKADASVTGIRYAADNGAKIINLSFGGEEDSQTQDEAVRYALSKGVTVVAAAGNTADGAPEYPAAVPGVIAVGATDSNDQVTYFSSYGPFVSVVAPGVQITSTNINRADGEFGAGNYATAQGTSFSAPIVSGIASLLLSVNKNLTPAQVKAILEGTADGIGGANGRTDSGGYGRVNSLKALQAVQAGDFSPGRHSTIIGKVSGLQNSSVVLNLDPGGNLTPDPDGSFQFSNLGPGNYSLRAIAPNTGRILGPAQISLHGTNGETQTVNFDFTNNTISVNGGSPVSGLQTNAQYFAPTASVPAQADLYYFKTTGHTLGGTFKSYWDNFGGLATFGFPISEPFQETSSTDGKIYTVQYFERNRFELHPEFAGTPNEVLLGLLGSELTKGRVFAPAAPPINAPNSQYFPQTQHNLAGRFLNYWQNNGGLAIFGFPISEPIVENGLTVQYFERNRFEYHPENAGTKYEVLLGLLGVDLARTNGYTKGNS